jgi:transposase-like protein
MGGWNNFVRMMGDDVHYQRYEDSFKMRLVREYYKTDVSQKSLENKYCIGGSSIYKWTSLPSILERFLEEEGCKICSEEELEKIVHAKKLPLLKDKLKKAGLSLERGGKKFYGSRKYLKQLKLLYDLLLSS